MNKQIFLMAAFALSALCWVGSAQAGILFSDDFESYTDVTNSWYTNTDNDPAGYTVIERDETMIQVHQSPMQGSYVFDTPYGSQFLHVWRDYGGPCDAWKTLNEAQQAEIAANGEVRIEFYAHNVYDRDGWAGNIGITAFDSAPGVYTGRAISLAIKAGGALWMYQNGSTTEKVNNAYNPNSWDKYTIDMDFTTDRWSVAVNDEMVADNLFFEGGDLDQIQSIVIEAWDQSGASGRGGFDNLSIISPIPEPSLIVFLATGLVGLAIFVRRKRK